MKKSWSNTALVAYVLLPKIVKELDFGIANRVKSSYQSKHLKIGVSNEQLIGEIIEMTEEKRRIVNLRYAVCNALKNMKEKSRDILIDRMINKKTFGEISESRKIAMRTTFRRLEIAEDEFAKALSALGYGERKLQEEFSNDKYVGSVYKRIQNDKYFVAKNM